MRWIYRVIILLCLLVCLGGCSELSNNTSTASYISDVVTYSEGHEAFVCYFVLKDASGDETANDGRYTLKVEDNSGVLYTRTRSVKEDGFQRATVGRGAFERKRLLYYVGRITYDDFSREPEGYTGTVSVEFRLGTGRTLYGEDMLLFD